MPAAENTAWSRLLVLEDAALLARALGCGLGGNLSSTCSAAAAAAGSCLLRDIIALCRNACLFAQHEYQLLLHECHACGLGWQAWLDSYADVSEQSFSGWFWCMYAYIDIQFDIKSNIIRPVMPAATGCLIDLIELPAVVSHPNFTSSSLLHNSDFSTLAAA